jgi:predicted nucleic acid-binding protein
LEDIVVDTNVLAYAANPGEIRQADSIAFLDALLNSTVLMCVDDRSFSMNESANRSQIGQEYIEHLHAGDLGYQVVTQLASFGRLKFLSRAVSDGTRKKISQRVVNRVDRIFLQICCNSNDKILASHDYDDFPDQSRTYFNKALGTAIRAAAELTPLF